MIIIMIKEETIIKNSIEVPDNNVKSIMSNEESQLNRTSNQSVLFTAKKQKQNKTGSFGHKC